MPENAGSIQYDILGNTRPLEQALERAERDLTKLQTKFKDSLSLNSNNQLIQPKIDVNYIKSQLNEAFKIPPIKVQLDLSGAKKQLADFQSGTNGLTIKTFSAPTEVGGGLTPGYNYNRNSLGQFTGGISPVPVSSFSSNFSAGLASQAVSQGFTGSSTPSPSVPPTSGGGPTCPRCGKVNRPGTQFCTRCGYNLGGGIGGFFQSAFAAPFQNIHPEGPFVPLPAGRYQTPAPKPAGIHLGHMEISRAQEYQTPIGMVGGVAQDVVAGGFDVLRGAYGISKGVVKTGYNLTREGLEMARDEYIIAHGIGQIAKGGIGIGKAVVGGVASLFREKPKTITDLYHQQEIGNVFGAANHETNQSILGHIQKMGNINFPSQMNVNVINSSPIPVTFVGEGRGGVGGSGTGSPPKDMPGSGGATSPATASRSRALVPPHRPNMRVMPSAKPVETPLDLTARPKAAFEDEKAYQLMQETLKATSFVQPSADPGATTDSERAYMAREKAIDDALNQASIYDEYDIMPKRRGFGRGKHDLSAARNSGAVGYSDPGSYGTLSIAGEEAFRAGKFGFNRSDINYRVQSGELAPDKSLKQHLSETGAAFSSALNAINNFTSRGLNYATEQLKKFGGMFGSGGAGGGGEGNGGGDEGESAAAPSPRGRRNPLLNRVLRRYGIGRSITTGGIAISAGLLAVGEINSILGQQEQARLGNITGANAGMAAYMHRQIEQPINASQIFAKDVEGLPFVGNLLASGSEFFTGTSHRKQVREGEGIVSDYENAISVRQQNSASIATNLGLIAARNGLYGDPEHQITALHNRAAAADVTAGTVLADRIEDVKARFLSKTADARKIITDSWQGSPGKQRAQQRTAAVQQAEKDIQLAENERNTRINELNAQEASRKTNEDKLTKEQAALITKQYGFSMDSMRLALNDSLGSALAGADSQYVNDPARGALAKSNIIGEFGRVTSDMNKAAAITQMRVNGSANQADIQSINDLRQQQLRSVTGNDANSIARRGAINAGADTSIAMVTKEFNENVRQMAEAAKIGRLGLTEFGSQFKIAAAQIEENYKKTIYGHEKDAAFVSAAGAVRASQLDVLHDERVNFANREQYQILQLNDQNKIRREQLRGNGVGAIQLAAKLRGDERLAALKIEHDSHQISEDAYIQKKVAIQEENRLDRIDASRQLAAVKAASVGSFMGAFHIGPDVDSEQNPQAPIARKFGPPTPANLLPKAKMPVINKSHSQIFGPETPANLQGGKAEVSLSGDAIRILNEIARNTAQKGAAVAA